MKWKIKKGRKKSVKKVSEKNFGEKIRLKIDQQESAMIEGQL
jgi:hypothetical protein